MKQMSRFFNAFFVLSAIAASTGCSGGNSSPPAPVTAPVVGNSLPSSFGRSNASATVVIKASSAAKRATANDGRTRDYISSATQGLIAQFVSSANPSVTTYQGFKLQPGATASIASPASCTAATATGPEAGSYTCSLYFALSSTESPYTVTLTTYDAAQSGTSGAPVAAAGKSSAMALSTATSALQIVAGQSNSFTFTLHGIVEAFEASPQYIGVAASPSPNAQALSSTFHALDGDDYFIDAIDDSTTFFTGAQPGGPFAATSFAVTATDNNTCATVPCISLASPSPAIAGPTTETVSFAYNGMGGSGDGTANDPPYYGLIGVTGPQGYGGNVSATIGETAYAATAYVVPFFGVVDTSGANAAAVDASDVSFTSASESANLLALQFHLATNSTGYSVDASSCGAIASASGGTALASGYGESYTLTPGTKNGTCTVTLSDGAGDTSAINVSNALPAVTFSPYGSPDSETCADGHACNGEHGEEVLTVTATNPNDQFTPACGNDTAGFICGDAYQANGGEVYCDYNEPGYESAAITVSSANGGTAPTNTFNIVIFANASPFECTFTFNDATTGSQTAYEIDVDESASSASKRGSGNDVRIIRR